MESHHVLKQTNPQGANVQKPTLYNPRDFLGPARCLGSSSGAPVRSLILCRGWSWLGHLPVLTPSWQTRTVATRLPGQALPGRGFPVQSTELNLNIMVTTWGEDPNSN